MRTRASIKRINSSHALDDVCRLAKDGNDYKDILRCAMTNKNTIVLDLYNAMQSIDKEENKTICTICCEDIDNLNTSWKLPCSHSFHIGCISKHFANSGACTCPNCRMSCSTTNDDKAPHNEEEEEEEEEQNEEEDEEGEEDDEEDNMSVSITDEDHDAMIEHLVVKLKTKLFMRGHIQNPNGIWARRLYITKDSRSASIFKAMLDKFGTSEMHEHIAPIHTDGRIMHTIVPNPVIYLLATYMLSVTESEDEENTVSNGEYEI